MEQKQENKVWQFTSDDEYYTLREDVQTICDHINLPKNKIIWCPFDLEESHFVKVFREQGYKVINTHISTGQDFFTYEPDFKWDIIISNPPFKGKANIMRRLQEFNKPFCLIFGIQCFNSGGFISELSFFPNLQMTFFQKRFAYTKDLQAPTKGIPKPTFHSMLVMNECMEGRDNNISIVKLVKKGVTK